MNSRTPLLLGSLTPISLLSKEYKGIAGMPEKSNSLQLNTLEIFWQSGIPLFRHLCRIPFNSVSINQLTITGSLNSAMVEWLDCQIKTT